MRRISLVVIMTVFLGAVSALASPPDQQMIIQARIKLYKKPDVTSICYRYLDPNEKVSILSKTDDGWIKVGTAHKFESGKQMVGYINPGLSTAKMKFIPGAADAFLNFSGQQSTFNRTSKQHEIELASNITSAESQLKAVTEKKDAELAALNREIEAQKKALADAAIAGADKDTAISALRAQAADAATKLATIQSSIEIEVVRLLAEKTSSVKLRGFGSVRLIPLLNDYLVIIPPDLAQKVDSFFQKIQKRILVGKAGTYLICDRKYFVPATAPVVAPESGKEVQQ